MTARHIFEELAELEHNRWSRWMEHQMSDLSPVKAYHWGRQAHTTYAQLSEREKDSDRNEVRIVLSLLRKYTDEKILALVRGNTTPTKDEPTNAKR